MKRDSLLFIEDMIEAMEAIERFVEGKSKDDLFHDEMTLSAVLWKLSVIGEAAKHVPQDIREKWPQIPWKGMAGMRDRLIHAYFGIDRELLWEVVKTQIPRIKSELRELRDSLRKGQG